MQKDSDFFAALTAEIDANAKQDQLSGADVAVRKLVVNIVAIEVKMALPLHAHQLQVLPFGSFVSGLASSRSDLDIVVTGVLAPGVNGFYDRIARMDVCKHLDKIVWGLRSRLCPLRLHRVEIIRHARIPIAKLKLTLDAFRTERDCGLPAGLSAQYLTNMQPISVDISLYSDSGVKAAEHVLQERQRWPSLRPLFLVVKSYLSNRGLNDVSTGGLSSYGLIYMVLALLQMEKSHAHDLGYMLFRFFQYYGNEFRASSDAISTVHDGVTSRMNVLDGFENTGRFLVVDPLSGRHITEGCYRSQDVRNAFQTACKLLNTRRRTFPQGAPVLQQLLGSRQDASSFKGFQ